MKLLEEIKQEKKVEYSQKYVEPATTNTGLFEIFFNGEQYIVPKTTGGLFC
jgi:hypothetical protein